MGIFSKRDKLKDTYLSEEDVRFLEDNTNMNLDQILEWHTSFLKDCPNGQLDRKKYAETYQKLFPQGNAEKYANLVFSAFDLNENGKIKFKEFMLALAMTKSKDLENKLKLTFRIADSDRDGKLVKKDLEKLLDASYDLLNVKHDKKTIKELSEQLFNAIDFNSSGSIKEDEFIAKLSSNPELMRIIEPVQ